jgi:hypothetical protein
VIDYDKLRKEQLKNFDYLYDNIGDKLLDEERLR